jgi:hypothetical protein
VAVVSAIKAVFAATEKGIDKSRIDAENNALPGSDSIFLFNMSHYLEILELFYLLFL